MAKKENMQTEIVISKKAEELAKDTETLDVQYSSYKITTQPQFVQAAEDLKVIKGKYNEIENERKELTRPIDEGKRRIMDFFRAPLTRLASAEANIKRALLSYQQEQQRIAAENARKIQERADKAAANGKAKKAAELQQQAAAVEQMTIAPKVAGISTRTAWHYRVVDESIIPREYLEPKDSVLSKLATATKGHLKIPGIEFYSEEIMSSGR